MSLSLKTRPNELLELRLARLRDCIDPATKLFGRQIRHGEWAPTLGTEDITSTAICLIGLSRAGVPIGSVVPEAGEVCRRMAARIRATGYHGGLGLVLWANAALRALSAPALLEAAGLDAEALGRAIPTLTTMEVAWMVSGLLHDGGAALRPVAVQALWELERRCDPHSLVFYHAGSAAPLRHRLRRHVANFADQVYPVQALAFASIVQGGEARRQFAERCGARMVSAQGPLGQWWWHHDAGRGTVSERFPVYSVHQHSMAPMALRALAVAGGNEYRDAVTLSRAWLSKNELGIEMADPKTGIVWRSIERDEGSAGQQVRHARLLLGRPAQAVAGASPRFRLNREMRPYEWGWLLYVTAIETEATPPGHIV